MPQRFTSCLIIITCVKELIVVFYISVMYFVQLKYHGIISFMFATVPLHLLFVTSGYIACFTNFSLQLVFNVMCPIFCFFLSTFCCCFVTIYMSTIPYVFSVHDSYIIFCLYSTKPRSAGAAVLNRGGTLTQGGSIKFQGAGALMRCTTLKVCSINLPNNTFAFTTYYSQGGYISHIFMHFRNSLNP